MAEIDGKAHPAREGHGRIDDIEVLRAFAVGMVLIEHIRLNLLPWVSGLGGPLYGNFNFWSGVDLFLAISGFVIARSLLPMLGAARNTPEFFNAALSFWVRRAWRLLPSAWLWLAVILICAAAFNRSGAFMSFRADFEGALAAVLNIANLRTVYTLMVSPIGATFPYWSLSLEEQFYLVLPFLIYFARGRLSLVLLAAAVAQIFVKRVGPGGHLLLNMTRSDALSLGVLVALWSGRPTYRRLEPTRLKSLPVRMLLPPVFVVAFAALSSPRFVPENYRVGLIAIISAAIVWLASYNGDYLFPQGPLKRLMCWLGARSYAIYLIHIPAFFATREVFFRLDPHLLDASPRHAAALLATSFPLLFALVELNYRFVELPLRKRGARIAARIRQRDVAALGGSAAPTYA